MNFYCDLCLDNTKEKNSINFNELISCSILDSYQILSINTTLKGIIPSDKKQGDSISYDKNLIQELYTKNSSRFLNSIKPNLINWDKISIYKRLTIELSDQKELFQITKPNNVINSFDILAVKPLNDKILESCLSNEINCDIIVVDMYEKFSFMPKKKLFQSAADKGMFFEVEYSQFITDNESRSNFVSNFILLNQVLKGKNLILSSGAENIFMQRNPDDVINIFETIFDIKKDLAFKMITENPIKAVIKSKQRKLFKTTLGII